MCAGTTSRPVTRRNGGVDWLHPPRPLCSGEVGIAATILVPGPSGPTRQGVRTRTLTLVTQASGGGFPYHQRRFAVGYNTPCNRHIPGCCWVARPAWLHALKSADARPLNGAWYRGWVRRPPALPAGLAFRPRAGGGPLLAGRVAAPPPRARGPLDPPARAARVGGGA